MKTQQKTANTYLTTIVLFKYLMSSQRRVVEVDAEKKKTAKTVILQIYLLHIQRVFSQLSERAVITFAKNILNNFNLNEYLDSELGFFILE